MMTMFHMNWPKSWTTINMIFSGIFVVCPCSPLCVSSRTHSLRETEDKKIKKVWIYGICKKRRKTIQTSTKAKPNLISAHKEGNNTIKENKTIKNEISAGPKPANNNSSDFFFLFVSGCRHFRFLFVLRKIVSVLSILFKRICDIMSSLNGFVDKKKANIDGGSAHSNGQRRVKQRAPTNLYTFIFVERTTSEHMSFFFFLPSMFGHTEQLYHMRDWIIIIIIIHRYMYDDFQWIQSVFELVMYPCSCARIIANPVCDSATVTHAHRIKWKNRTTKSGLLIFVGFYEWHGTRLRIFISIQQLV